MVAEYNQDHSEAVQLWSVPGHRGAGFAESCRGYNGFRVYIDIQIDDVVRIPDAIDSPERGFEMECGVGVLESFLRDDVIGLHVSYLSPPAACRDKRREMSFLEEIVELSAQEMMNLRKSKGVKYAIIGVIRQKTL